MGYIDMWKPYGPIDAKWLGEMDVEMYLEYLRRLLQPKPDAHH